MKLALIRERKLMKMLPNIHNMILRCTTHRLPNICHYLSIIRGSAIFINGTKASENYVFVVPHIDFYDRLQQEDLLLEELKRRKSKLDLNKMKNLWSIYEELKLQKFNYDKQKEEISKQLTQFIKSQQDSDITRKLKIQFKLLKENTKKLKVPLWSAEEAAVVEFLKLPNVLHPKTPVSENSLLYSHLVQPKSKKDHLKVAMDLNLIHFKKNENYYLKGDAAVFELGAKFYVNSLLKKNNFVQFSNPDFVKSVVIEGCGLDHRNPDSTFILHHNEDTKLNVDNRLHLIGGGTLQSFMAYFAKNVAYAKFFPLKLFTMGRQYTPSPSDEDSLFHVSQSSVVHLFGATSSSEDMEIFLTEMIEILKLLYSQLGYHFQISILSADKLYMWESLRVVVEMYSSSLKSYVEVAYLSLSGDFISKRLMFTFVDNKQSHFPHIISGTVLNVPRFLACVLEQDREFAIPIPFKVENWF